MQDDRLSPSLRWAASHGVARTVELHIPRGDNINARDRIELLGNAGWPPLMAAIVRSITGDSRSAVNRAA